MVVAGGCSKENELRLKNNVYREDSITQGIIYGSFTIFDLYGHFFRTQTLIPISS